MPNAPYYRIFVPTDDRLFLRKEWWTALPTAQLALVDHAARFHSVGDAVAHLVEYPTRRWWGAKLEKVTPGELQDVWDVVSSVRGLLYAADSEHAALCWMSANLPFRRGAIEAAYGVLSLAKRTVQAEDVVTVVE